MTSFSTYLKKFRDVCDDIPEDEFLLFRVKPSQLGDTREERDQALNDELRQLRLIVQVRQNVVSYTKVKKKMLGVRFKKH